MATNSPVRMVMNCPGCGKPHIDHDKSPPHKEHTCSIPFCYFKWTPHDFNTLAVASVTPADQVAFNHYAKIEQKHFDTLMVHWRKHRGQQMLMHAKEYVIMQRHDFVDYRAKQEEAEDMADETSNRLDDVLIELQMLRETMSVDYEPHQSLRDRTIERAADLAATEKQSKAPPSERELSAAFAEFCTLRDRRKPGGSDDYLHSEKEAFAISIASILNKELK